VFNVCKNYRGKIIVETSANRRKRVITIIEITNNTP